MAVSVVVGMFVVAVVVVVVVGDVVRLVGGRPRLRLCSDSLRLWCAMRSMRQRAKRVCSYDMVNVAGFGGRLEEDHDPVVLSMLFTCAQT